MEHGILLGVLACAIGIWMTWGVGANDLANIMSTTIGSKAVTLRQAIAIAICFEFLGALLGGDEVSDTIRGGIIDTKILENAPHLLVYSMLSVLMAGAVWINLASFLGMPVSITNAIVGALVGVGAIVLGLDAIHWGTVGYIALSWITSPTFAGMIAYLLFVSIKQLILGAHNPLAAAERYVPFYLLLVGIVLSMMTTLKALNQFHILTTHIHMLLAVIMTALIIFIVGLVLIRFLPRQDSATRHMQYQIIERMFSVLMALTSCAMVFAHGSNDVAIAVGPVSAIMSLVWTGHPLHEGILFNCILFVGCISVLLGLLMYGRKVIATVGSAITTLTPSRAFAATIAAASTVVISTSLGIPVSATQTLVGAVFGVGLARGIDALNLEVIRNIFMSWVVTIPVAASLATAFFYILQATVPLI